MMTKNRLRVLLLTIGSFIGGIFLFNFSPGVQTSAQRITRNNHQIASKYQSAAVTRIWVENPPPDNLARLTGNVEVTFFKYSYDRVTVTEGWEVRNTFSAEAICQEILQTNNLKNTPAAQQIASSRAADLALAKALTKLGEDGWEIVGRSFANMDFETLNQDGMYKNSLLLRKLVSQQQISNQQ